MYMLQLAMNRFSEIFINIITSFTKNKNEQEKNVLQVQ